MPHISSEKINGFSLVELAIVITIIALLTGGVLTGQHLMKAADSRGIYTKAAEYIDSINKFNEKYQGLPGDLYNAITIWGPQHATAATCQTTASSSPLTCNGDGDGHIGDTAATYYENFRAWQQLKNAGMIDGSYTGVTNGAASTNITLIGTNVPAGPTAGTGFSLFYLNSGAANVYGNIGHAMYYGAQVASGMTSGPVISTETAWAIDKKVDDSKPAYGKVITNDTGVNADCATTAVATTAEYKVSDTKERTCSLIFLFGN